MGFSRTATLEPPRVLPQQPRVIGLNSPHALYNIQLAHLIVSRVYSVG